MHEEFHGAAVHDDRDANAMLNDLLLHLEGIIGDVRGATEGMPQFVVEARLREKLRAELPAITFTADDISDWAARFSS